MGARCRDLAFVIRTALCVVAGGLTIGSVVPYLRDIRRGTTRPQRTSWFVFATLAMVAAVSQFVDDPGPGAWLAAGAAGAFTLVFVVSIRHGVGGFDPRDVVALAVASIGGVVSMITARPLLAVIGVVVAEMGAVRADGAQGGTSTRAPRRCRRGWPTAWPVCSGRRGRGPLVDDDALPGPPRGRERDRRRAIASGRRRRRARSAPRAAPAPSG